MGKFDGVMLVADFDNTLRPYGFSEVPEANIPALNYFTENGGLFTIATGRDLRSFNSIKDLFPLHIPAILSNGAAVYDKTTDSVLFESTLPQSCADDLAKIMRHYPAIGVEVHRGFNIYVPRMNRGVGEHLARMGWSGIDRSLDMICRPWTKFALFTDTIGLENEFVHDICAFVESSFEDIYEPVVTGGIVDVASKGVNKASGVRYLAGMFNISREHLYCVGDSWNDLPMLSIAKTAFVPASAISGVRNSGAVIVSSAKNGCIKDIVGILDSIY